MFSSVNLIALVDEFTSLTTTNVEKMGKRLKTRKKKGLGSGRSEIDGSEHVGGMEGTWKKRQEGQERGQCSREL